MGNHRATRVDRRAHSGKSEKALPGRRRAARQPSGLTKVLPSAPVLVGVAALAISAGGAVTSRTAPGLIDQVSQVANEVDASAAIGAAAVGTADAQTAQVLQDRQVVVSRDSRRDALEEKADAKLVEAAEAQAQQRNAALKQFRDAAEKQAAKIKTNQWVLPLSGYRLTGRFGASSSLWANTHTGLDFAAPSGSSIRAVAGGVVTETGYDGSYGNKTVITLDDGTEIWYCHQTSFLVNVGDTVRSGDVIGTVGSTGNSTGPHLHLEVRPGAGDPVDPFAALIQHGVTP
jgi:murein DD-endopeptidase MepM/ murein hydrolase activator NlpD